MWTDINNYFTGTFCEKFAMSGFEMCHHTVTTSLHYLVKYKIMKKKSCDQKKYIRKYLSAKTIYY